VSFFAPDLLSGRSALVTGGGSGIGRAVARTMARAGAQVTIASRKLPGLERAVALLAGEGLSVRALPCDIRDRAAVDALVAAAGPIDILVNNGGGQFLAPAEAITPGGWDAVVGTNLTGTWNLTLAAANAGMLQRGGAIVNITMLTARGFGGMAHSVAARAGVEALTRNLAVEWASRGVRVNAVAPGYIASTGLRRYPQGVEMAHQLQAQVPMKRLGTCAEVAAAVTFLASDAASYVTGQVLTVCGGRSLWGEHWPVPDPEGGLPPVEIED
jgi:citronellol/citronellal dehydrogenase